MENELKELLQENIRATKANQELLEKLLRYQRWSQIVSITKWIIVIGSAAGALYFLEPMLNELLSTYNSLINEAGTVQIDNSVR